MGFKQFYEAKEVLKGGKADNIPNKLFDPKELKKGSKEEREHVKSKKAALEIAKDHLYTSKDYYKKLKKYVE